MLFQLTFYSTAIEYVTSRITTENMGIYIQIISPKLSVIKPTLLTGTLISPRPLSTLTRLFVLHSCRLTTSFGGAINQVK